jgi:hypothetical protein
MSHSTQSSVIVASCSQTTSDVAMTWIHTECPLTDRKHCWKRTILAPLDCLKIVVPSYHVLHVNFWLKVAPTESAIQTVGVNNCIRLGGTSQCVLGGEPCRGCYTAGQLLVVKVSDEKAIISDSPDQRQLCSHFEIGTTGAATWYDTTDHDLSSTPGFNVAYFRQGTDRSESSSASPCVEWLEIGREQVWD